MSYIFNSVADVAVLLLLVAICFGTLFVGGSPMAYGRDHWYRETAKKVWLMPPGWLFAVVWAIIYLLIVVSFYIVYQVVDVSGAYGLAIDALTLLFVFNIMMNKLWSPVFFGLHQPVVAALLIVGIEATCAAILYFMFTGGYITSFWIFLPYPIWCLFALYLNCAWAYFQYKDTKSCNRQK